ncbi:MAG: late competence development ComFB family protein [Xenococcaceae cyanobacterium MO_167.B27]|nr:late competence development ComFB family protein [Xenococcaceae cyanobacterium MO_167.B27]
MENSQGKHISTNVMEELVAEEIEKQLKRYPKNTVKLINHVEVATYALNRLPPLYASSYKGLNQQKFKGKSQFNLKITQVVREAITIVQQDLLRDSSPLTIELDQVGQELQEAENALRELGDFLPNKEISWKNLVRTVKPILIKLHQKKYQNKDVWQKSVYQR